MASAAARGRRSPDELHTVFNFPRVALPADTAVLLASGPLGDGLLPPDTAAWLRMPSSRRPR
jgi:hypothetical protein